MTIIGSRIALVAARIMMLIMKIWSPRAAAAAVREVLQTEGTHCSSTEQAFFMRIEIGHSHGARLCPN